jgi:hypothetical protein
MAGSTPERRHAERRSGIERRSPPGSASGRGIADLLDPAGEEAYWRENYTTQPYYEAGLTYDDYHPGYRTGWEGRARYEGRSFDDVEHQLRAAYERTCRGSRLGWERNRHAARAAWDRFDATDPFERSQ